MVAVWLVGSREQARYVLILSWATLTGSVHWTPTLGESELFAPFFATQMTLPTTGIFFSLVHDVKQGKNVITLFLVDLVQHKQITLLDERPIDIVRDRVVIDGHQHGLLATTPAEFSHTFTCLRH